jgi:hypothetical protein
MAHNYYHNDGYTRGGLDVTTGVNLFFKGILLFPVFVLTGFIGLTMIKHVLFNGIPVMNSPTEEQREVIRERDHEVVSLTPAQTSVNIHDVPHVPPMNLIPAIPELPDPIVEEDKQENVVSNCPVGHPMRNVTGANGLPWVCSTSEHQFYEMDEDYTAR